MKIGILGGGQLALMLAQSASPLGIQVICVDPNPDCPAKKVAGVIHCEYSDANRINQVFQDVDCVTYETENLPVDLISQLSSQHKITPNNEITHDTISVSLEYFETQNVA